MGLTPQQWDRVKELYEAVLERTQSDRDAYLEKEGDDKLVRNEVLRLLEEHDDLGEFLSTPAFIDPRVKFAGRERFGPGDLVARRFRIVSFLAAGGMGEVYKAEDTRLDRSVVLKFLPEELERDSTALDRFQMEARAASSLNHPNICTVYDFGEGTDQSFIAMECLEGKTLKQAIANGPMELTSLLFIATQIIEGLNAAHARGIIHRDIKSGNIFLAEDGPPKILDFGIAKHTLRKEEFAKAEILQMGEANFDHSTTRAWGTIGYMSPEQAQGEELDVRTDLFSFGLVLYEMATGKLPVLSGSGPAALEYSQPSRLNPDIPSGLDRIINKALEKDRKLRYQSAAELRMDLQNLSTDLARPGSLVKSAVALRRNAAWKLWILVGLVGAFAIAGGVARFSSPLPAPKLLSANQITHDGVSKSAVLTDGDHLLVTESNGIKQVLVRASIADGSLSEIHTPFPSVVVYDISADHSQLLISDDQPEDRIFSYSISSGVLHPLGSVVAHAARWSHDGRKLAFAKASDIYLSSADGTNIRRLMPVQGSASSLRFSPDDAKLRFTVTDSATGSSSIWQVRSDGTDLHQLMRGWHEPASECCGDWSSDGRYYFFVSSASDTANIWTLHESDGSLFRRAEFPFQLTNGPVSLPSFAPSPDGRRIFAAGHQLRAELVGLDPRSGLTLPFLSGISAGEVEFSRDGRWVTYVTYPDRTLWRSRPDGSERLQLTHAPISAFLPRWSPDGSRIAFTDMESGRPWKILLITAQGGQPEEVLSEKDFQADVGWSSNGRQLVFGRVPFIQGSSEKVAIYIYDLDSNKVSIVPGSENMYSPRWSPDGNYLAAHTSDAKKLLAFDFRTNKWTLWLDEPGDVGFPHWSLNGEYVYYCHSSTAGLDYRRVKLGDTHSETVIDLKKFNLYTSSTGIAPDGSLLFTRDIGYNEIYSLDLDLP